MLAKPKKALGYLFLTQRTMVEVITTSPMELNRRNKIFISGKDTYSRISEISNNSVGVRGDYNFECIFDYEVIVFQSCVYRNPLFTLI